MICARHSESDWARPKSHQAPQFRCEADGEPITVAPPAAPVSSLEPDPHI